MRILYIAKIDEDYSLDFGVAKKINGQIKAFKELGLEVDYIRLKNKNIVFNNEVHGSVKYRYFAYTNFYKILKSLRNIKEYDFVYLRYVKGNEMFYKAVKLLKKNNVKIVVEIPTYPYKEENKSKDLISIKANIFDDYITKRLKKYVDRIAINNTHTEVFGIKTININNGIDIDDFELSKREKVESQINLVGIANLARWHGYDRVIKGLADYYKGNQSVDVNFYIIGEGSEKKSLEELTAELKVEKYVKFLGAKRGEELDNAFDIMDIGVSSLALFRAGGGHDPIKSKEFLARGIPVMLAYDDKLIDMSLPYVCKFSEDDENIDILKVVDMSKSLKNNNINSKDIRKYAEDNLSWKVQMKKVKDATLNK